MKNQRFFNRKFVPAAQSLQATDKEQTVCDMIRCNRHAFHLYETELSAYNGEVNPERLDQLAGEYKIPDRLRQAYQAALQAEAEDT